MLDGYDRNKTVTDVLAVEVLVLILQYAELSGILVHHAGESSFKAGHKSTAVHNVDTVTVWIDLLREAGRVLKCDLYLNIAAGSFNIYRCRVKCDGIAVDIADKALNTKLLLIGDGFVLCLVRIDQL